MFVNFITNFKSVKKTSHWKTSSAVSKLQQTLLFKTPFPFLITLLISFTIFNHATILCINTRVCVLINQYWTGLFVIHYSVRRRIQLHEKCEGPNTTLFVLKIFLFADFKKMQSFFSNRTVYFLIVFGYRGGHWKDITIYNVSKVNLEQKKFVLMSKNVVLNTGECQSNKQSSNLHHFCLFLNCSVFLFSAALCELIVALHKDALFHCCYNRKKL